MKLRGKFYVTLRFDTVEDVPPEFEELARKLLETQDVQLVPVIDNFTVALETEFGAENVEIINFDLNMSEENEEVIENAK